MGAILRKLIREPLVHFALLGALIFLLAGRTPSAGADSRIVVTQRLIENLVLGFSRTWMRPPTQEEVRGLVDDYVREEVLYREARAMGLDQDDVIVRRRMRQKLEFLSEEQVTGNAQPAERELETYLRRHPDRYGEEPSFTFEHIFFSREKRGASTEREAKAVLVRLNGSNGGALDVESLGDGSVLPFRFERASAGEMDRTFGGDFGRQLAAAAPGVWAGPLESSYGLHLVRVEERMPGAAAQLANVRDSVLRDLLNERRRQALDAQFAGLRARYTVVIEPPDVPKVAKAP